jgi:uncharacterized delta-60 repeat protein
MRCHRVAFSFLCTFLALKQARCQTNDTFAGNDSGTPYAFALRPDSKILVAGWFTGLDRQPRMYIGQLNIDGTLDTGFNPGASNSVSALALQEDGKIVVGGFFTALAGQSRGYLARLNPDGSLDNAFTNGASGPVYCVAIQPDQKILVGGNFTSLAGQARGYIGRFNPDGTLDMDFHPEAGEPVTTIAVQSDSKILIGGWFITLGGQPRVALGRVNGDGTLDGSFTTTLINASVYSVVVQPDGKIIVGGDFVTSDNPARTNLARLDSLGSLDQSFAGGARSGSPNTYVNGLALQADGKILVGGNFSVLAGTNRSNFGRLNSDGSADAGFNHAMGQEITALALQADGKILVGSNLDGTLQNTLVRLAGTGPATQNLAVASTSITWTRGGTAPEVWRTTFESSSNGTDWASLGDGARIPGGWELDGISLPPGNAVRARGFLSGGYQNGSCWFVQSVSQPLIVTGDGNLGFRTNKFGFTVMGSPGKAVVVEASSNLATWTALTTNTPGVGAFYFSDPSSAGLAARFYRAHWR